MATNTPSGEGPKGPQASIPVPRSKRGFKGFFAEVGREMKKVNWPTRAETNRLTGVVLAVCVLMVTVLVLMSYGVEAIIGVITRAPEGGA